MAANRITFSGRRRLFSELITNLQVVQTHRAISLVAADFVTPLGVLPVCALATKLGREITLDKDTNAPEMLNYMRAIGFPNGHSEARFQGRGTHLPVTRIDFPVSEERLIGAALEYVSIIISGNGAKADRQFESNLEYAFIQFAKNALWHSHSRHYWMFGKKSPASGVLEFCLVDDGIGMRAAFKEAGRVYGSDIECLIEAVNGCSSQAGDGGLGIKTALSLLPHEEFMMISGNGGYIRSGSGEELFETSIPWRGLIICARLKFAETSADNEAEKIVTALKESDTSSSAGRSREFVKIDLSALDRRLDSGFD